MLLQRLFKGILKNAEGPTCDLHFLPRDREDVTKDNDNIKILDFFLLLKDKTSTRMTSEEKMMQPSHDVKKYTCSQYEKNSLALRIGLKFFATNSRMKDNNSHRGILII